VLNRNALRLAIVFSVVGLLVAASPAEADSVQITLNNLAFDSSFGSGPEDFNGSFLYDTVLNAISSVSIAATGATDSSLLGAALLFGGVDSTGTEPFQFQFDDGLDDFLNLSLSSGLSASSYGFGDASLLPLGGLASLGFGYELASSGSFSVVDLTIVPTPEPGTLLLLFAALLLLGLHRFVRGLHRSHTRAPSMLCATERRFAHKLLN